MLSITKHSRHLLFLAVAAALMMGAGHSSTARAATWSSEGHADGAQCKADDANDSGIVVGFCRPANASGPPAAWVALTAGTETPLAPLSSGQGCLAEGVTDGGVIIGKCLNAQNVSLGVFWLTSSPNSVAPLNPLTGLLGIGADVSTMPTSTDQNGFVTGESINASGGITTVVWPSGSSTATEVSPYADNCISDDVNNTNVNGFPTVALNCPNSSGTTTAEIAQATGLLNAYVMTPLPTPSGSSNCSVQAVNDSAQAAGTCFFPGSNPQAAFWSSPTSAPLLLSPSNLPAHTRTGGTLLNNSGNVVVAYISSNGQRESAFWNTSAHTLTLISPLSGGVQTVAQDLADNNTVALNSADSAQNVEAAVWTTSAGTVALGFYGGGAASATAHIAQGGHWIVGGGQDSSQNYNALYVAY